MKNINKKSKILKINNKTQKGILPYRNKKGYLIMENYISLIFKKSFILSSLHLKDLKLIISKSFPKSINKFWNITPLLPLCKREGSRMGKGKSKINSFANRFYRSFILLNIKINFKNFKDLYNKNYITQSDALKEFNKFNNIFFQLNKILFKYPQFLINKF